MMDFINQKITASHITTLIKVALFSFLSTESLFFSIIISSRINEYIANSHYENVALIISVVFLLLIIFYLRSRDFFSNIVKILRSVRIDIFLVFYFGVLISLPLKGIGTDVYKVSINALTDEQLLVLVVLPFIIGLSLLARIIQTSLIRRNKNETSFFLSDVEQKFKKDDLLGFSEEAERFAERVFNRGSLDSMIFGIDAPWGIGKSTFVNFCEEYWKNNYKEKIIVYSFNPLRYKDRANLLEKFIDGLIYVIQKNSFVPEIKPLITKYSQFIKGVKGSFSIFGFEIFTGNHNFDNTFENLETALLSFNKKIIIVVDDLDRLTFSEIKDVLFVVKKSFTLPNISYVLCYDAENISVLEKNKHDVEKITEFLEKFVNVKYSIFLDNQALSDYISKNLETAMKNNLQVDPFVVEQTKRVVEGILEIYKSQDFHKYFPFIGDVRKLKRLINTLLLLEIEKTDFDNSDFDNQDLIHLLLIYINYPSIFRKIYNTETKGKRGFFSVLIPYDDDYPKNLNDQGNSSLRESIYKNSVSYTKYIKLLSENQRFLLNKVFNVSYRLEETAVDSVPREIKHSYACFNGGWSDGKNLEGYLNLIVKLSKPQRHGQYRFYLNCKNEIADGKAVEEALSKKEFSYSKSESSHEQFWKIIVNSSNELDSQAGVKLITYLLDNIQNYSLFTNKDIGVGLRDDLSFFLVKLLDNVGWSDQNGQHQHNTEEYVVEIAEWIFGEKRHAKNSVIKILAKENRGVLGLYDLLVFRLFCSSDRGGDIFNLQRALSKHGDPEAPTEGLIKNIAIEEMREISQKVFKVFKSQYIKKNKNIFELIDSLSLADFAGKYQTYIETKIASNEIKNIDESIGALKSRLKSFITYQLGNSLISSGVGCGYYNSIGKKDNNTIKNRINKYLFDECFNPKKNENNYEHFVDYLLINFASVFGSEHGREYIPSINEFTKVLERKRLANYWKNNAKIIKKLNLLKRNKTIFVGNYIASYNSDLIKVYEALDKFLQETEEKKDDLEKNKLQPIVK